MDQFKLRFIKFLRINAVGNELLDGSRESSSVPSKVNISAVSRGGGKGGGGGVNKSAEKEKQSSSTKSSKGYFI